MRRGTQRGADLTDAQLADIHQRLRQGARPEDVAADVGLLWRDLSPRLWNRIGEAA